MANSFAYTNYLSNETLVRFANELQFIKTANRTFEKDYKDFPVAIGTTINYRLEENYLVNKGRVASITDRVQLTRPLTITEQDNITVNYTSFELTFNRAKDKPYLDMSLSPRMRNLANSAEDFVAKNLVNATYNVVGTPGTAISSPNLINAANWKMTRLGLADSERYLAMNTKDMAGLANGVNNYFNTSLNTSALRRGYVGELADFDIFASNFLDGQYHVAGTGVANVVVNGLIAAGTVQAVPTQGSNTIVIQGFSGGQTGTFLAGDIIQIANVLSVNPITKKTTSDLATFVVTANAPAANGSGYVTLTVSPSFSSTGAYQNITALPQVNAAVSLYASHNVNIAYQKNAIVFAAPPLDLKKGGVESSRSYSDMYKISMRYEQGADILNDLQIDRIDIAYGVAINPEYSVRIVS